MSIRKVVIKVINDPALLLEFDIPSDFAGSLIEADIVEIGEEIHYQDKRWGFIFPQELVRTSYEPDEDVKGSSRRGK